jgi:DNA (cytosine-5)-methyltransferase 1
VEPCSWCVGDGPTIDLRALGVVLADLATLGFDAEWVCVPASDVGAPHKRDRWFLVAYPEGDRWDEGWPESAGLVGGPDAAPGRDADVSLLPTPEAKLGSSGPDYARMTRPGTGGDSLHETVGRLLPTPMADDPRRDPAGVSAAARAEQGHQPSLAGVLNDLTLLPTPTVQDGKNTAGPSQFDRNTLPLNAEVLLLLPTPAVNDMGAGKTPDDWDAWTQKMKAEHANGNGHGKSLHVELARLAERLCPQCGEDRLVWDPVKSKPQCGYCGWLAPMPGERLDDRLLPTPSAASAAGGQTSRSGDRKDEQLLGGALLPTPKPIDQHHVKTSQKARDRYSSGDMMADVIDRDQFGSYGLAIARWQAVLARPAPPPTELTGKDGGARLSPPFVEWMMGLPAGWITEVPGITRNEALKACGNGVVPQQAVYALRILLARIEARWAA